MNYVYMFTIPDCARHKGRSLAYLLVVAVMKWDLSLLSRDTLWIQIFHLENVSRNGRPWRCFGHIPMATKLSTHPCLDPQRDHPWGGACRDVCSSRRQGNNKCHAPHRIGFPSIQESISILSWMLGSHFDRRWHFLCHIVQGPSFWVRRLKMPAKDLIWKWLYLKHFVNNQVLLCHGVAALVPWSSPTLGSMPSKGLQRQILLHELEPTVGMKPP